MISSIRLQNFRSYGDESFEFDPSVNIIVGPNASGKTNLIEAIYLLANGNSFRARDQDLVKFNKSWSRVDGNFGRRTRTVKLQDSGEAAKKTFLIDDKPYQRLNLDRTVPLVFFEPNHLQLISRSPELRREFIDDLLERSQVGYKKMLASYRRALAQRNALLKKGRRIGEKQLFAWDIRLSELGSQIAGSRSRITDSINNEISQSYSRLAQKKFKIRLNYDTEFPISSYASRLLSKLEAVKQLDFERGFTNFGPHREDISIYINQRPIQPTASRGETRSLVLALKVFELNLIETVRGQTPILLLDDVFSELDGSRRHMLVDFLNDRQTIITTTDADAALKHFTGQHSLIPIAKL